MRINTSTHWHGLSESRQCRSIAAGNAADPTAVYEPDGTVNVRTGPTGQEKDSASHFLIRACERLAHAVQWGGLASSVPARLSGTLSMNVAGPRPTPGNTPVVISYPHAVRRSARHRERNWTYRWGRRRAQERCFGCPRGRADWRAACRGGCMRFWRACRTAREFWRLGGSRQTRIRTGPGRNSVGDARGLSPGTTVGRVFGRCPGVGAPGRLRLCSTPR